MSDPMDLIEAVLDAAADLVRTSNALLVAAIAARLGAITVLVAYSNDPDGEEKLIPPSIDLLIIPGAEALPFPASIPAHELAPALLSQPDVAPDPAPDRASGLARAADAVDQLARDIDRLEAAVTTLCDEAGFHQFGFSATLAVGRRRSFLPVSYTSLRVNRLQAPDRELSRIRARQWLIGVILRHDQR